jgi:hypothetical protein
MWRHYNVILENDDWETSSRFKKTSLITYYTVKSVIISKYNNATTYNVMQC